MKKKDKKKTILIISISIVVLIVLIASVILFCKKKGNGNEEDKPIKEGYIETKNSYITVSDYESYLKNKNYFEYSKIDVTKEDFDKYSYILVTYTGDNCSERVVDKYYEVASDTIRIYYDINRYCGVCAPLDITDIFKVDKSDMKDKITSYYKVLQSETCNPNVVYKPMIYIYPTHDMDLTITLGNKDLLTSTYPKYTNSWNVHVNKDGNIFDYNTKRNYYGLYWEAIDTTPLDMSEGFVVKGSDTVKFLEEKLELLGLNEYEINEFIVYWISKLENNNYNFFRFRTIDEINKYMPLNVSEKPDTLIRILIDYKPLDEYVSVKEQVLNKNERKGFTIIEWGLTPHLN